MVFRANDPKTKEAQSKGGKTGKKHFAKMPKSELKKLSSKAGKRSGETRRRRAELNGMSYEDTAPKNT